MPTRVAADEEATDSSLVPTRWSLIGRLKNREDQESWRQFFETYWKLIYNVTLKSGLSHTEAQEVVQETVLSVCRSIGEFTADPAHGSFKSWLFQLTRWRIVDQVRKRPTREILRQEPSAEVDSAAAALAPQACYPEPTDQQFERLWDQEWESYLLRISVEKLKQQVSPAHFQVFFLHVVKNVSAIRTSRALGVGIPQVYLIKHRVKPIFERIVREEQARLEQPCAC